MAGELSHTALYASDRIGWGGHGRRCKGGIERDGRCEAVNKRDGSGNGRGFKRLEANFQCFQSFSFLFGLSNHLLNHCPIHPQQVFMVHRSTKSQRLSRLSFPSTSYRPSPALPSLKPLTHKAPVYKLLTYLQAIYLFHKAPTCPQPTHP